MTYAKHVWNPGESGGTPITAAKLNEIEQQLEDNDLSNPTSPASSGLSATIVAAIPEQIRDPESPANDAVGAVVASGISAQAGIPFVNFIGTETEAPRAGGLDWAGPWIPQTTVNMQPTNLQPGDSWQFVTETVLPFPSTLGAALEAWWDASTDAPSDGAAYTSRPDKSGKVRDLTPTVGPLIVGAPKYAATGLNGTPCMSFPATTGFDTGALDESLGAGPLTVFATIEFGAPTGWTQTAFNGPNATNLNTFSIMQTESSGAPNQWDIRRGGTLVASAAGAAVSGPRAFVAVFDGASSKLYVDGTQIAAGNPGANEVTRIMLGLRDETASASPNTSAMTGGKIGQFVIMSGAADSTQIADGTAWLKSTAGLS